MVRKNEYNCGFCRNTVQGWDEEHSTKSYDRPCDECILPKLIDALIEQDKIQLIKAVKKWLKEEWNNINISYGNDDTNHRHPRWKLKEILEIGGEGVDDSEEEIYNFFKDFVSVLGDAVRDYKKNPNNWYRGENGQLHKKVEK